MRQLKMFGMPIVFSLNDNKLVSLDKEISYEAYFRKCSQQMFGLLADPNYNKKNEHYYDFYKSMVHKDVRIKFSNANLRYDATVIMEGCASDEFKKTSGHFHHLIPGRKISYPELYQVVKGTALFVMQKVDDYMKDKNIIVKDAILAEVREGQSIVIPPGYGHCTVNVSNEPMIFVNLVSCKSENYYDSIKKNNGMCCYVFKDIDGGYKIEKNPKYNFECDYHIVIPRDNSNLGIKKDVPIYESFLENPDKYEYLNNPEKFVDDFFEVFEKKSD